MANNIALTVPTLTTPGPAYASQISGDLTTISTHNHDGVNNGTTIDIAAQTVGEDLSLIHHNLSNVRSVEFDNEPAALTGSQDVLCLYVNQGNLGFNNSDGIFVPITSGTTLAPAALSTLNWIMRNGGVPVTSNASVLATDLYNFVALNSAGGSFTVTLPLSSAITPSGNRVGRLYMFRDANNQCTAHPVTIQVAPASGDTFKDDGSTSFVVNANGAYVGIYTDGAGAWFTWSQNVYQSEQLRLNGGALTLNASALAVSNGTTATVDSGSTLNVAGSMNMTGTEFISGQAIVPGAGQILVQSGGNETFQSGSTLTLNAGSATTAAGAIAFSGTLSGSGTITGSPILSGSITGTNGAVINNAGTTFIAGERYNVAQVSANYAIDTTGVNDRYISCLLANNSNFTITLPPSPATGRLITIADGNGQDPTVAPGYIVNIAGNGKSILNFLPATAPAGGSAASQTIQAPGAGGPITYGTLEGGWAFTLIYNGTVWCLASGYGG